MNAEVLAPVSTAVAEYSATEAGLAALRQQLAEHHFDCTTTEGDKEARQSRRALVSLRTDLEAKRKELKAPLLERSRLIDDEAKRITGEIVKLEAPIDDAIRQEEARREAIRAERERIDRERKAANQARVDAIREIPLGCVGKSAAEIKANADAMTEADLSGLVEDFHEAAREAYAGAMAKLDDMHAAAVAQESEAARLAAEREAEAARLAAEREEQRQAQAAEQARLDAERAELARDREAQEAALRAEQQRLDAERAEADRLRREQQEREDAERAERQRQEDEARETERRRLAEEAERVQQERRASEAAERERQAEAQRQRWADRKLDPAACMTGAELDALCSLLMAADGPEITDAQRTALTDWADAEARRHGFEGWIDALHGLAA